MPRRTVFALAGWLCCAIPAFAQDRLWFFSGGRDAAIVTQVEAGFHPGARDIGTFNIGATRSVTIPNVPAGIYYVHVRAVNELGASAPSEDVRVDVR